jgi:hypothetical protein
MTILTALGLPVAGAWTLGSGWVTLLAIGAALCAVCMIAGMWFMRDGCSMWGVPRREGSGR